MSAKRTAARKRVPDAGNRRIGPTASHVGFSEEWLSRHNLDPGKCSVIRVEGTGMCPTLEDEGLVMVDHQRTKLIDDAIFAVCIGDKYVVGRVQRKKKKWRLIRDAPGSEDLDLPPEAEVCGQVVWAGKTLLGEDQRWCHIRYLGVANLNEKPEETGKGDPPAPKRKASR